MIQYTKRSDHSFNVVTFWPSFVSAVVRDEIELDVVHVYIALIDIVSSDLKVVFTRQRKAPSGTRSTTTLVDICCVSTYVNVDTVSVATARQTAEEGLTFCIPLQDDTSASVRSRY